jgi:hypothetical protein
MRTLPRSLLTALVVCLPAVSLAAPNADLEKATRLVADLQYGDAAKLLDSAWKRPGNDRETVLKILELQGVVAATLNQGPKASKYFQTMLVIDSERRLTGDHPPRVMTPFYEAKGWVSDNARLQLKPVPATIAEGKVLLIAAELISDPMKMGRKVRFHVRSDAGPWSETVIELAGRSAAVGTDAVVVEWWAELLGDREMVLALVGSTDSPRLEGAPKQPEQKDAPVVTRTTPKKKVVPEPEAPVELTSAAPSDSGGSVLRPVGYVLLGTAAAAGLAGGFFGLQSSNARNEIESAQVDAEGRVIGITQKRADELDKQSRSNATLANGLFGGAAALAVAGGALYLFGGDSAAVAVTPTVNGLAIGGTLP